jgi:sulfate adenylyltransferase subunit 1
VKHLWKIEKKKAIFNLFNTILMGNIIRFSTAGSVDDGKSTLIGRLMYETKSIFEDQLLALEEGSKKRGLSAIDLSLLTDGLKDEREQGITIDVAYRYFATAQKKFIIADTPGHVQYTRNMVTGASNVHATIILIDARKGALEQTYRHLYIADFLKVKTIFVCINKMDLVDYSQEVFNQIKEVVSNQFSAIFQQLIFIPVSALVGDNITEKSNRTYWYSGKTLLENLEAIETDNQLNEREFLMQVQQSIRPRNASFPDYRGYTGKISSGKIQLGDAIQIFPSLQKAKIKSIIHNEKLVDFAVAEQSVCIELDRDLDIARGDVFSNENISYANTFEADICVLDAQAVLMNKSKFIFSGLAFQSKMMIEAIQTKINWQTLEREACSSISVNEIGRIKIKTIQPIPHIAYNRNKTLGSFILIDETTHQTIAGGVLV